MIADIVIIAYGTGIFLYRSNSHMGILGPYGNGFFLYDMLYRVFEIHLFSHMDVIWETNLKSYGKRDYDFF